MDLLNGCWRQRGTTGDQENGNDASDTYPVSATSMQTVKGRNRGGGGGLSGGGAAVVALEIEKCM